MRDFELREGNILLDEEGYPSTPLIQAISVDEGVALDWVDREGCGKVGFLETCNKDVVVMKVGGEFI